jgi:hypothetical protein
VHRHGQLAAFNVRWSKCQRARRLGRRLQRFLSRSQRRYRGDGEGLAHQTNVGFVQRQTIEVSAILADVESVEGLTRALPQAFFLNIKPCHRPNVIGTLPVLGALI